jgi:fatty-acyl-CoA synthase
MSGSVQEADDIRAVGRVDMARGSHTSQPAWSYVAANASQPVLEQTLGDALRLPVKTWPSKLALIQRALETSESRKWTFQDLIEQSEQVARALLSRFEPGDHIAIWMANQPEWVLVEFGAALAGLTLVTVNPAFLDEELIFVLKQSKARGIVVQDVFRDRSLVSVIERVRSDAPSLETIIRCRFGRTFSEADQRTYSCPTSTQMTSLKFNTRRGRPGSRKARLTHRNLANNGRIYTLTIGAGPDDTWINPMPMFHTAGCGLATLGGPSDRGHPGTAP